MLNSYKLLKISAKASFQLLRKLGDLQCTALSTSVKVQKLFYNHISTYEKKRTKQELVNRILIIPLIPNILENGEVAEERKKEKSRMNRITYKIRDKKFSVIIVENSKGAFLLSCFQDY